MVYGPERKRASEVLEDVRKSKRNVDYEVEEVRLEDQFVWDCCDEDDESRHFLENLLPSGYSYNVSKLKIDEQSEINSETKFLAKFSVNVCKEEAKCQFLEELGAKTETSYRPKRKEQIIKPSNGSRGYTSNRYNCDRNVRHKKKCRSELQDGKNTDCPAFFSYKFFGCKNDHHSDQACSNLVVILSSEHNHALSTTDSWNFLKVTDETKNRYIELF